MRRNAAGAALSLAHEGEEWVKEDGIDYSAGSNFIDTEFMQ